MSAVAAIGHNNPPLTPFEAIETHVSDLMVEVGNWCDGAKVENQAQADAVSLLIEEVRKSAQMAEDARKKEAKPFDDGKAEVQARYHKLIGDTKGGKGVLVSALESLKATLAPFLIAQEAARKAEADRLRKIADEQAEAAAAALRATDTADLAARQQAEEGVRDAARADRTANAMEAARPAARGGERAVSLRTYYTPVMLSPSDALRHYMATRPDDIKACLQRLAELDVREGKRAVPGFRIDSEQWPV